MSLLVQLTISVCFPGLFVMFHCVWNPIRKKNVKPNKRVVSTKSTRITIILNPPARPLRRFDLLQTFSVASNFTSSFYSASVKHRIENERSNCCSFSYSVPHTPCDFCQKGARAPQYMLKHHESICSPQVSFKEAVAEARRNWFDM